MGSVKAPRSATMWLKCIYDVKILYIYHFAFYWSWLHTHNCLERTGRRCPDKASYG